MTTQANDPGNTGIVSVLPRVVSFCIVGTPEIFFHDTCLSEGQALTQANSGSPAFPIRPRDFLPLPFDRFSFIIVFIKTLLVKSGWDLLDSYLVVQ